MARRVESTLLDRTYLGTGRTLTVFRWGEEGARPKFYAHGGLHAGEPTGVLALHHLAGLLDRAEDEGRIAGEIVLVPAANPIGLGQFLGGDHLGRVETASLINFNREHYDLSEAVFAQVGRRLGKSAKRNVALIRQAAVEAASAVPGHGEWASLRRTLLGLSVDADVALDLHSDMAAALFMYTNAIDDEAARVLGADLGCEAIVNLAPYVPSRTFCGVIGGLFPRLAERAGAQIPVPQSCFAAMIEMRGRHHCDDATAAADAANLFRYLTRLGAIAGEPGPLPDPRCAITPVEGMDVGYAPIPGLVVCHVEPGAKVKDGDVVCEVIDPTEPDPSRARRAVRARSGGTLYARALAGAFVMPGRVLFRIAGPRPLAHRKGRSWLDD